MSWQPPYHSSKFRHVFAKPASRENHYTGLPITRSVHDNAFCAVNPRFIAVVTECAGGGAFLVISIYHRGRVDPQHSRVCGHHGRVLDVRWDPFSDLRIASCSEDCTVKVWNIPPQGLRENIVRPVKDLRGHTRRVGLIEWHPIAKDILLSSAYDYKVLIWRLDGAGCVCRRPVRVIGVHSDLVLCLSFNTDGSRMATTCRDRTIRIIHTLSGQVLQRSSVCSHRPCKVVFASELQLLVTTGASYWNQRQIAVWDSEDLTAPLWEEDLDGESGVLFPFFDPDTHMIFLAGKGDGNTRFFDLSSVKPYLHYLAEYRSPLPQRSLAVMPKRGLDVSICEVFRFYRVVGVKDLLEPLSLIVPRRAEGFQDDLYPPTAANEPALTADQWVEGHTRGPLLMSLRPGTEIQNPYPAPEPVSRPDFSRESLSPLTQLQPMETHYSEQPANHSAAYIFDISDLSEWQEDDTHTLKTQPMETHSLDWGVTHTASSSHTHTHSGAEMLNMAEPLAPAVPGHTHNTDVHTALPGVHSSHTNTHTLSHTVVLPATDMHLLLETQHNAQGNSQSILHSPTHSTLVWCESPVYTPPSIDDELLCVFYRQCEELRSLRAELQKKDMRINQLEQDITHLRNTHTHSNFTPPHAAHTHLRHPHTLMALSKDFICLKSLLQFDLIKPFNEDHWLHSI
ncbi:coronin-2B [Alosa pseudoharengus]|uniref:coronin-2B n=1 Tax=Alosa pseudoharengus TaxID=34774 RepID=UPI003F8C7EC7